MAETGIVIDLEPVEATAPFELINLGIAANLGQAYNSTAATGDHTTLASAYTTGYASVGTAPPNIVKPIRGWRMPHGVKSEIYLLFRVPLATTMTTGITFEMVIAVDPVGANGDVTGTKAYFDVVGAKLNASVGAAFSSVTPDDSQFSTTTCVALQTGALPTTAGQFYLVVLQATNACLGTPAVSCWQLVRIRRLGDHQNDTNTGVLDLVHITAYGY
jgi:hypothetical protein